MGSTLVFDCPACFAMGRIAPIDLVEEGSLKVTCGQDGGEDTWSYETTCPDPRCGTVLDLVSIGVLDGSGTWTGKGPHSWTEAS